MYDEVDLEDIECRLYCQVYHSSVDAEESHISESVTKSANTNSYRNRYFSQQNIDELTFIPLEVGDRICPSIYNHITFNTDSCVLSGKENFDRHTTDNNTVTRYDLRSKVRPSEISEKLIIPVNKSSKRLERKKRRQQKLKKWRQRLKEKSQKRKQERKDRDIVKNNTETKISEVICISDESENEDVIKTVMSGNNDKQDQLKDVVPSNAVSDLDDDVVYIPPPPVEVINIDVEEPPEANCEVFEKDGTIENLVNSTHQLSPSANIVTDAPNSSTAESVTSNDFLDNAGVEVNTNNFNFSLHGSDFNNTSDFVRPGNPTDYCETESSCSTNDFNRENSSLKTVVFNEVDFPREDIFSDKNLESFGSYITPKRSTAKKVKSNSPTLPKRVIINKVISNEAESSMSSSESDYEFEVNTNNKIESESNRKLPMLSPMCDRVVTPTAKVLKQKTLAKTVTKSSRRKSDTLDSAQSNSEDDSRYRKRKMSKKKKLINKKDSSSAQKVQRIEDTVNNEVLKKSLPDTLLDNDLTTNDENGDLTKEAPVTIEKNSLNISQKQKGTASTDDGTDGITILHSSASEFGEDRIRRRKKRSTCSENSAHSADVHHEIVENISMDNNNSTKIVPDDNDFNNIPVNSEVMNENSIEKPNKSLPCCSSSLDTEENEIIVINDDDSNTQNCGEIVVSSDSEYNFDDLDKVGHDLNLANCSEFVDLSGSNDTCILSKDLHEDFNNLDVEQIHSTQSDNPELWKVLPTDQFPSLYIKKIRGPRCIRCRQFGHIAVRCLDKTSVPNCSLCGGSDHQEPRCPNKMCTQCGNKGNYSTTYCHNCFKFRNSFCNICQMKGHIAKMCPDTWRRYHLTTEEGPIVVSQGPQLKPRDQLWCSGCARQGHLEHECDYYNRQFPPTSPCIFSYDDILRKGEESQEKSATVSAAPPQPPPPVWNTQNIPSSPIPYVSFNSQLYIPPLMSQISYLNQVFTPHTILGQNKMLLPNNNINCTINFNPSTSRIINPNSVAVEHQNTTPNYAELNQLMLRYIHHDNADKRRLQRQMGKRMMIEFLESHRQKVKTLILEMPPQVINDFLRKELDELENVVSQSSPRYLRSKLYKYDVISIKKSTAIMLREKCFWFRVLNMFIFGVHQLRDGKLHINCIKNYISKSEDGRLDMHKRKSLLSSYNYIFKGERSGINYYKILKRLMTNQ